MRRVAILLVPIALLLAGCAAEPAAVEAPAEAAAALTAGWTSFESACGFRLLHPPTWQVLGSDLFGLFVVGNGEVGRGVSILALPAGAADEVAEGRDVPMGGSKERVVSVTETTFMGLDAKRLVLEGPTMTVRGLAYALEIENAALLVFVREEHGDLEESVLTSMATNGPPAQPCRGMPVVPDDEAADADAPWRRFESPLGWTVDHPADWSEVPMSSTGEALLLLTPTGEDDDFQETLMVVTKRNTAGVTLEEFATDYIAALEAKYPNFELVSVADTTLLGADATRIVSWEDHIGGTRWFMRSIVVLPDWVVLLEGEFVTSFGEHAETMSDVGETFRFSEDAEA